MSLDRAAGGLTIALPIAFNTFFFLLARLFDYPSVLRSPAGLVLSRFLAGGLRLMLGALLDPREGDPGQGDRGAEQVRRDRDQDLAVG